MTASFRRSNEWLDTAQCFGHLSEALRARCDSSHGTLQATLPEEMKKVLETERLVLREMDPGSDATLMLELLNEPAFIRYVADRGVRTTQDASRYITEKILPSYEKFRFGFYVMELKETSEAIGICGLVKRDFLETVDIGFSTAARYWGRGYTFEAASALITWARRVHGLTRIAGIAHPDNEASTNLLQKLGLRFERMISLPGTGAENKLFS